MGHRWCRSAPRHRLPLLGRGAAVAKPRQTNGHTNRWAASRKAAALRQGLGPLIATLKPQSSRMDGIRIRDVNVLPLRHA